MSLLFHATRLRQVSDLFRDYERCYATFLQIADVARIGPDANWRDLEARIGWLQVQIGAMVEETQLALIQQAAARREEEHRQREEDIRVLVDDLAARRHRGPSRRATELARTARLACRAGA